MAQNSNHFCLEFNFSSNSLQWWETEYVVRTLSHLKITCICHHVTWHPSMSFWAISKYLPYGAQYTNSLIQKYAPGVYHILTDADICNSFAQRLVDLFKTPLQIYWVRRQRDSVLIISGYDLKIFSFSLWRSLYLPLCVDLILHIRLRNCDFRYFESFRKSV